ncbi:hypothetical protein OS493_039923 [Desmophyllum pertusum]|uniref:Uncharacterized protein n=1 Tax=Desmophyllum pertusum TaxID=174260 RepID=A0A9W9Z5Y9_9CNID|nr:hypothetical protein OS493_039923 [Desmophyllum pertusum]
MRKQRHIYHFRTLASPVFPLHIFSKKLIQYLEDTSEQEEDIREFVAPINDAPVENLSLYECFRIQSGFSGKRTKDFARPDILMEDQIRKQQNLTKTKIASAIEFRMEASSHSCVLRRSENCSFDNEAERGNAVLSKKCSTGSTISATKFCSAEECFQYLAEVGMANDEIDQLRERHGQIYPSGYYEERVACEDQIVVYEECPNSQIKRLTIETPKVSVDRPGHYADSQEMKKYEESNEHVQRAIDITNSSFACDSPIDSTTFWQKDFFTPSKHVSEFFSIQDLEGKNDVKFQDFIRVFPTEISSIIQALRKSRGSAKTVPAETSVVSRQEDIYRRILLQVGCHVSHCLEEICRCSNSRCFYRIRGVKYDIVCRLYEHIHEHKVSVPPSILYMKIKEVKEKLQEKGMSFSVQTSI